MHSKQRCLESWGPAKPTKKQILKLTENMFSENKQDIQKLLGAVLIYFQPSASLKAKKSDEFWVSNASSNDGTLPHIQNPYVSIEGDLIATNGHRMHILHNFKIPDTDPTYLDRHTLTPITPGETFPPYEQVIPIGSADKVSKISLKDFKPWETERYLEYLDAIFERKYIIDAFARTERMTAHYYGQNDPLKLTAGKLTAVVMPLRREKLEKILGVWEF